MATEPISTAYSLNPFHQSVFAHVSLLSLLVKGSVNTFPWQRIRATTDDFLDACAYGSACIFPLSLLGNSTFPRQRRIVQNVLFSKILVVSNECRQGVLPRISCIFILIKNRSTLLKIRVSRVKILFTFQNSIHYLKEIWYNFIIAKIELWTEAASYEKEFFILLRTVQYIFIAVHLFINEFVKKN
jgi:hypothetical protein